MHTASLAFISMPGGGEWIFIAMLGLLLFGKRLPEVARSMGKCVTEFKKGLQDVSEDIQQSVNEQEQPHLLPPPASSPAPTAVQDPAVALPAEERHPA